MFLENGVVLCLKWDGMGEMLAYDHRWWMKVSKKLIMFQIWSLLDRTLSTFSYSLKTPYKEPRGRDSTLLHHSTPLFSPPFICCHISIICCHISVICCHISVIGSHTPSFTTTNNPFRRTHIARLTIRNTIYSSSSLSSPISCNNSSSLSNSISFLSIGYASISIDTLTIGTTVSASISDLVNIGTIVFVSDIDNSFVPIPLFSSLSLNPPSSQPTS